MAAVAHLTLDRVRAAAREVAEVYGLDLVVLFGSAARDGFAEAGDVDLAVTGGTASDDGWGYGAEAGLSSEFARRLGTGAVDLVKADRASALLQAHVARDGVPVYERRPGAFAEFRAAAERRFEEAWPQYEAEWEEDEAADPGVPPPEARLPALGGAAVTPVDRGVVWRKLEVIARDLELLRQVARRPLADYLADYRERTLTERLLQRSLEAALDTCAYLLREAGHLVPEAAHDKIEAAGAAGIIPGALAAALAPSAGLRNRLVHEYDDLNDAKVHEAVSFAVDLLPQFADAVERYLDDPSR